MVRGRGLLFLLSAGLCFVGMKDTFANYGGRQIDKLRRKLCVSGDVLLLPLVRIIKQHTPWRKG